MSFRKFDTFTISLRKQNGWWRGYINTSEFKKEGLIPSNYVRDVTAIGFGRVIDHKSKNEPVSILEEDPSMDFRF